MDIEYKALQTNKHIPLAYGDRYIARRYIQNQRERELINIRHNVDRRIPITLRLFQNNEHCLPLSTYETSIIADEEELRSTKDNINGLHQQRTLIFSDPNLNANRFSGRPFINGTSSFISMGGDWPCRPRTQPMAEIASAHALVSVNQWRNETLQVEWCSSGHLAIVHDDCITIYNMQKGHAIKYRQYFLRAIAYSPNGDYLAIGYQYLSNGMVELWRIAYGVCSNVSTNMFHVVDAAVRSLAWNMTGNVLACGTASGSISFFRMPQMRILSTVAIAQEPIVRLKFSPNMFYLACGHLSGHVTIFNCHLQMAINCIHTLSVYSTIFDWHPWNGILAICKESATSIELLSIPSMELRSQFKCNLQNALIKSVNFSKLTGELLIGLTQGYGSNMRSEIVVLSSFHSVVDLIKTPDDRSLTFLTWSTDGTQLLTDGNDNHLYVWNFFPQNDNTKGKSKSRNAISSLNYGPQFCKWSSIR